MKIQSVRCAVKVNNSLTDWFFIKNGVHQGCILSPLLFGITIDWVMKRSIANKTTGIKWLNNTTLEDLDFADGIALLSHSYNDQQIKTTSLSEIASQVCLLINSAKTKILETLTSPNTITLNGNDIEKVNNFTYSYISNDGNITKEVKIRIAKAAAIFRKLNTIWKSNNISRNLKLKIFSSNIITSLSYGSECWYST